MRRFPAALAALLLAGTAALGAPAYGTATGPGTKSPTAVKSEMTSGAKSAEAKSTARRAPAMSERRVEEIQAALDNAGASIAIDGIWGSRTTRAVRDFQKQHDLRASGRLNHATLKKLNPPTWNG